MNDFSTRTVCCGGASEWLRKPTTARNAGGRRTSASLARDVEGEVSQDPETRTTGTKMTQRVLSDMALDDAWGFLQTTRRLIKEWDADEENAQKSDAQKKVGDMLTKDFATVDWEHNALTGNHDDVQTHIEHAMNRAQMRMYAISAHNLDHPCLKGDEWFYKPTFFNSEKHPFSSFDTSTGNLCDRGRSLHDIVHNETSHGAFLWGGDHHQDNMPEGLGAARPPRIAAPKDYPEHAAPGFGTPPWP